ncbi:hypothetical protein DPV78_001731 [Talaromyces pinophilus]|nr:hypothetical protein DPV78_001731 [Talaromyces pinophilus]
MTFPNNPASENVLLQTSQALTTSLIDSDIVFQDPSPSLPYADYNHGLPAFTFNPLTSMPNNYLFSSLPAITQPQQYTSAEWAENITRGAPVSVPIVATNATGIGYQTEPSQLFRNL